MSGCAGGRCSDYAARGLAAHAIILPAFLLTGLMFIVYGTSRTPLPLAISLFFLLFTLPLGWGFYLAACKSKRRRICRGGFSACWVSWDLWPQPVHFYWSGRWWIVSLNRPASAPGAGMGLVLVVVGVVILVMTMAMFLLIEYPPDRNRLTRLWGMNLNLKAACKRRIKSSGTPPH